MSCIINSGYQLGTCISGIGGLEKIYLAPLSSSTVVTIDNSNVVTNISGMTFYTFDLVQETGVATENVVANIQNQSLYFEGLVTLVIPTQSATLRNQYQSLAATSVHVITKDKNGNYKLYGKTSGCNLQEGVINTGQAAGDANNMVLTFRAVEQSPAYFLNSGTVFTSTY